MEKIILITLIVTYSVLIAIQISICKDLLEIKKVLWKVAKNESIEFALENNIIQDSNNDNENFKPLTKRPPVPKK